MGFHRQGMPRPLDRAAVKAVVIQLVTDEIVALVDGTLDPFEIDDPCPFNAKGHGVAASCGEVVCPYCSKVFWT